MNREFEFFHGVVFARLLHTTQQEISVKSFSSEGNASYVLNDCVGLYIKYSTKRLSPWRFSFHQRHQDEILEMKNKIGEVFLVLVCNDDGIVTLEFDDLKKILNESHAPVEWISAARGKREMYAVKGSDGELEFKVGKDDFQEKIFQVIRESGKKKSNGWLKIFKWGHKSLK